MAKKGIFIVIEGLDGSGKTTQAALLADKLSENYSVVLTAEPSRGKIGTFIRENYLYGDKRLPLEAEALLFATDRIEHMQTELKPALDEGKIVICDRYIYSSLAYQGGTGLSLDWIKTINARALQPDFSILLDISPEQALERSRRKRSVMETLETQQKARAVYLSLVEKKELIAIDGEKTRYIIADSLYKKAKAFVEAASRFIS